MRRHIPMLAVLFLSGEARRAIAQPADTVLSGGKILTLDAKESVAQAIAIREGRIIAVGTDARIKRHTGNSTKTIDLRGRMVVPGLIESHVHPYLVAAEEAHQPYAELSSITEVQAWIRSRSAQVPAGQWIKVVRTEITRLKERRHPTPAELDAACSTHPVVFNAARKNVLNTLGFQRLGIIKTTDTFDGAKIIRDAARNPPMIGGGDARIREAIGQPKLNQQELMAHFEKILRRYNEVGISSIIERGSNVESFRAFQAMRKTGRLTVRTTVAIMCETPSLEALSKVIRDSGVRPGEGDEWVKIGPLRLLTDGGIHWGNTFLRVPYGENRMRFYRHDNADYRGDFLYPDDELKAAMRMGHRLGWQMTVHATGDAGVDLVVDAMEAANADRPIADRRFTLVHAYFPTPEAVVRAGASASTWIHSRTCITKIPRRLGRCMAAAGTSA
jgi:predicted amidohydrolase YtcJ